MNRADCQACGFGARSVSASETRRAFRCIALLKSTCGSAPFFKKATGEAGVQADQTRRSPPKDAICQFIVSPQFRTAPEVQELGHHPQVTQSDDAANVNLPRPAGASGYPRSINLADRHVLRRSTAAATVSRKDCGAVCDSRVRVPATAVYRNGKQCQGSPTMNVVESSRCLSKDVERVGVVWLSRHELWMLHSSCRVGGQQGCASQRRLTSV